MGDKNFNDWLVVNKAPFHREAGGQPCTGGASTRKWLASRFFEINPRF